MKKLALGFICVLCECSTPPAPAPAPALAPKTRTVVCPPTKPEHAGAELTPDSDLPKAYKATIPEQKAVVLNPATPTEIVNKIVAADEKARAAMKPWQTKHPHPTYEEAEVARDAIEALRLALAEALAEVPHLPEK